MPAPLRRVADARTGLYLRLGAALVAPAGALTGCQDAGPPPPAEDVALTGVETVIQQMPDGSYQIADEQVVDGRVGGVTIIHLDANAPGGTRTERLDSPEAFAARLPATPPDSAGLGAGAAWGSGGGGGGGGSTAEVRQRSGFGLGDALLMSAMFNLWRPPYYAGYGYAAPARAYTNAGVRQRSAAVVAPRVAAAGRRGTLATPSRVRTVQRAAATRASRPSGGRSGGFGRGFGRGGG